MEARVLERRKQRRIQLEGVTVELRPLLDQPNGHRDAIIHGRVLDVNLTGVYAMIPEQPSFAIGSAMACTVTIPHELARRFPFARLLGKGWVTRVASHPTETIDGHPAMGVAISFGGDVTALAAVPERG